MKSSNGNNNHNKNNNNIGCAFYIVIWCIIFVIQIKTRNVEHFPLSWIDNWLDIVWGTLGNLTIFPVQWVLTIFSGAVLGFLTTSLTEIFVGSWKNPTPRHATVFFALLGVLLYLYNLLPTRMFPSWWIFSIGVLVVIIPFIEPLLFYPPSAKK
ncbi:MAG: hypothetical protein DWQ04_03245 [Chloroflexi bacterium]|nr:MAG: hypothetical protein DWQ04_03245 [Chloroflexota bacterium]